MRIYAAVNGENSRPARLWSAPRAPPRFRRLQQLMEQVKFDCRHVQQFGSRRTVLAPEFNSKSPILMGEADD